MACGEFETPVPAPSILPAANSMPTMQSWPENQLPCFRRPHPTFRPTFTKSPTMPPTTARRNAKADGVLQSHSSSQVDISMFTTQEDHPNPKPKHDRLGDSMFQLLRLQVH
ncbi:hypothetical protein BCR44DRAFT_27590 [Catenaria anguillulae PL171]|uniref:Uncharacterized protein n=1 Tax=Catenaria anguillulae PL171 TaxID=765915 RepID=A0A1Y2HHW4_9FUNG|nr:hypothetical protein BCR44DRAFT_27590 [Catenaria anguillulae PL171]